MSQRDNFVGGFLLGTLVGGVIGGVVGVLATSKFTNDPDATDESFPKLEGRITKKRQLKAPTEQSIEMARRGLEDKIAQLNDAIDDVRQQLGNVNGTPKDPDGEQAIARDS